MVTNTLNNLDQPYCQCNIYLATQILKWELEKKSLLNYGITPRSFPLKLSLNACSANYLQEDTITGENKRCLF